jgi:glucose-1-phosphate thymidylyltransferase
VKAIILCAGEGTRLRPLTYAIPKHLFPLANRPVIVHVLDALRDAGIREVGVVVSPHARGAFENALGDGSTLGLSLSYIEQERPLGLAHAVACAHDFVNDEPFLVYLGDNLLERGVSRIVERFDPTRMSAMLLLAEVGDPKRFGVAVLEGDRVVKLVEKPQRPPSHWAIVGVYLFTSQIFAAIASIKPSARGELEITDAIQMLIEQGQPVQPCFLEGWWLDVGRPDDLLAANRRLLERLSPQEPLALPEDVRVSGKVIMAKDAHIERSELRGPLVIGAEAVIQDAVIGPYVSIDRGARIERSEIEDSIVMEGAEIQGVEPITRSLIGRHARLVRASNPAAAHRVLIADRSEVEIGTLR